MATNPFQQLDVIRNVSKQERMVSDCYRLMFNRKLWIEAYLTLYLNDRRPAFETIEKKIDKFTLQKIDETIQGLKTGSFRFSLISNEAGRKKRAEMLKDILGYEVIRKILDAIFEPVFLSNSHGFREGKGCYTALSQIKNTWSGLTWCIKGEIADTVNHQELIKLLSKKIDDRRFILLIHNALRYGVIKKHWYHKTSHSTPQGEMLIPLLTNIYLHELDQFMEKQRNNFDDDHDQKMRYIRYGGVFVIGILGNKQHAMNIKENVQSFLHKELALERSQITTRTTHLKNPVPFLGYEFRTQQEFNANPKKHKNHNKLFKKTTLSSAVKLEIPRSRIYDFALKNNYGNLDNFKISHRTRLLNYSEQEILMTYNTELRGIANYYKLADNYHHLDKLFYLAESSFIKTLANKRRSTSKKVANSMRKHKQGVLCLEQETIEGKILHQFLRLKDIPKKI